MPASKLYAAHNLPWCTWVSWEDPNLGRREFSLPLPKVLGYLMQPVSCDLSSREVFEHLLSHIKVRTYRYNFACPLRIHMRTQDTYAQIKWISKCDAYSLVLINFSIIIPFNKVWFLYKGNPTQQKRGTQVLEDLSFSDRSENIHYLSLNIENFHPSPFFLLPF